MMMMMLMMMPITMVMIMMMMIILEMQTTTAIKTTISRKTSLTTTATIMVNVPCCQVRSLSLMHGDKLTVNSTDDKGQSTVRHFTSAVSVADDFKSRTHDFPSSAQVTVTLETGLYTNGGEGFVICYQCEWE